MAKIIATTTYYAPTCLDHAREWRQKPTGRLEMTLLTSTYTIVERQNGNRYIRSDRGIKCCQWENDTDDDKACTMKTALRGRSELEELDKNPPLTFVPEEVHVLLPRR
jgi:hypothetical protein